MAHERQLRRMDSLMAATTTHFGIPETRAIYRGGTFTYRFHVNPQYFQIRPIFFAPPLEWNSFDVTLDLTPSREFRNKKRLEYFRTFQNIAYIVCITYFYIIGKQCTGITVRRILFH